LDKFNGFLNTTVIERVAQYHLKLLYKEYRISLLLKVALNCHLLFFVKDKKFHLIYNFDALFL